eukprot:9084346-Alexandrium_andersonii.AAC.1
MWGEVPIQRRGRARSGRGTKGRGRLHHPVGVAGAVAGGVWVLKLEVHDWGADPTPSAPLAAARVGEDFSTAPASASSSGLVLCT